MTRQNATNFGGALQFPYANASTDLFKKEDVQTLALAVDGHDHTTGKGLPITSIPNGTITSAMIADGTIDTADLKDGSVTSVKIADGTIAAADIANAAVTNAKLAGDTARANLLTNGGFEIWQRGNGPFTANATYTADRWYINVGGTAGCSVSRATVANADAQSLVCAQAAITGSPNFGLTNYAAITQRVDPSIVTGGIPVTFSVRVKASAAGSSFCLLYQDGVTSGGAFLYGPALTAGTAYATYSLVITLPLNATNFVLGIAFASNATFYLDNAMLVVGSQAADYAPLHPAEEIDRCQRYYEVLGAAANGTLVAMGVASGAGQLAQSSLLFKNVKATTPTVTIQNAASWTKINANTPTIASFDSSGVRLSTTSVAAGQFYVVNDVADTYITVEANP